MQEPYRANYTGASSTKEYQRIKYLHCPMITLSPSFTRKAGDTWAERFECRFSYLKFECTSRPSKPVKRDKEPRHEFSSFQTYIPLVLWHEVKIVSPNNDGPGHLRAKHSSHQDSSPDWHVSRERAFLVDVGPYAIRTGTVTTVSKGATVIRKREHRTTKPVRYKMTACIQLLSVTFNSFSRGFEAQSNILPKTSAGFSGLLSLRWHLRAG